MKPDVIAQTLQLEKERAKMAADAAAANGGGNIVLQQPGQQAITLNNQQVVQILQNLQSEVETQKTEIGRLTYENSELARKYELLQKELAAAAPAAAPAAPDDTIPETIYV
jgi:hypothetical protein